LLPQTVATLRERGYEPDKITVAHLLAHTSGIPTHESPAYYAAVLAEPGGRWTRREQLLFAIDQFAKVGAPGQTFSYSDTGYCLLGEIIEGKTGTSLGASLRSLLDFSGLGLASTWMEASEAAPTLAAGFAHSYSETGLDLRGIDATVDTYGGGGLVSTVGDLTLFFRALLEGRVVSAASLASMLTPFGPEGYGRGIFPLQQAGGQTCWGHGGFWGLTVFYCPASQVSVAVADNLAFVGEPGPTVNLTDTLSTLVPSLIDLVSR
jgi:D-alanyl-D-alanine carboxypeptidase